MQHSNTYESNGGGLLEKPEWKKCVPDIDFTTTSSPSNDLGDFTREQIDVNADVTNKISSTGYMFGAQNSSFSGLHISGTQDVNRKSHLHILGTPRTHVRVLLQQQQSDLFPDDTCAGELHDVLNPCI